MVEKLLFAADLISRLKSIFCGILTSGISDLNSESAKISSFKARMTNRGKSLIARSNKLKVKIKTLSKLKVI